MSHPIKRNPWEAVLTGVRIAGTWLLIIGWIFIVAFGTGMALSATRRVLGWALLLTAGVIAVLTVNRWARMLPAILGLGILNTTIGVWSQKLPATTGLIILFLLLGCSALALTLQSRTLTVVDRIALFGFLACQVYAVATFPSLLGFTLMFCSLAIAWGNDLVLRKKSPRCPPSR